MCKLMEEAMERNDEMTERCVADRRVVAVAGSDAQTGVSHGAWKRAIYYTDTINGKQVCRDDLWAITTAELGYLDKLRFGAPSRDRNSVIEEVAAVADRFSMLYTAPDVGYDNGYTMAAKRIAEEIRALKSAAPQQVDVVQAVPEVIRLAKEALSASLPMARTQLAALQLHSRALDAVNAALASPSPAVPPEPTDEPTAREALIACLGDDAVTLQAANPDDEMAQTMQEAAAMLEADGAAQGAVPEADQRDAAAYRALNTPEIADFVKGVEREALHQRGRWSAEHDAGKAPEDWFWLLGYLGGKALHAVKMGNNEKALHHTISSAAALLNWHAAILGAHTGMRPGSAQPTDTTAGE